MNIFRKKKRRSGRMQKIRKGVDPFEIYEKLEILGQGSYGSVFKCRSKKDGKVYAMKIIKLDDDESDIGQVMEEIKILTNCKSNFIVGYEGSFQKDDELFIILEYCSGGSLSDIMTTVQHPLTEQQIASTLRSVLCGLQYLHNQGLIHRDIKAGNVLLNRQGEVKLTDFGISAKLTETVHKRNTKIGTPFWMAPEIIKGTPYNFSCDIWSLGILGIELAEGSPPLSDLSPVLALLKIPDRPPPTLSEGKCFSQEFNDFLSLALRKDPKDRPDATQLLKHKFLKNSKRPQQTLAPLLDTVSQLFEEAGGREKFFQKLNADYDERRRREDNRTLSSDSDTFSSDSSSDGTTKYQGTMKSNKNNKYASDSDSSEESGTMVYAQGTMKRGKRDVSSSSDSETSEEDSGTMRYVDNDTKTKESIEVLEEITTEQTQPKLKRQQSFSKPPFFDKRSKDTLVPQKKPKSLDLSKASTYTQFTLSELQQQVDLLDFQEKKEIELLRKEYESKRQALLRVRIEKEQGSNEKLQPFIRPNLPSRGSKPNLHVLLNADST